MTREQFIEAWLDKYEQNHPDEKLDYEALREQADNDKTALAELKPRLTDLKHIRYNYDILERDAAPNDHHIDHRLEQER